MARWCFGKRRVDLDRCNMPFQRACFDALRDAIVNIDRQARARAPRLKSCDTPRPLTTCTISTRVGTGKKLNGLSVLLYSSSTRHCLDQLQIGLSETNGRRLLCRRYPWDGTILGN